MTSLVDVNVLLPVALEEHPLRARSVAWWEAAAVGSVVLCLPVRMAVFRLLTNPAVMGDDVLSPESAWRVWSRFVQDERTVERYDWPTGIDTLWFAQVAGREPSPKLWTDAWLAAFAESLDLEMVTCDKGFRSFQLSRLLVLEPAE